ncbi:MAG: SAM-dependent methyltransferase [Roseovarius sp.]
MTPLAHLLAGQIAQTGPITLADYMQTALLHPQYGYYATRDPLGAAGDFTTAPEISQMFGELVGLCLAQAWLDQGAPAPFALVELGPGRGTLMADVLRATKAVPGFHEAMRITLMEVSQPLREAQARVIGRDDLRWVAAPSLLPEDMPLFLIANEFFDALPLRQFHRAGGMWRETMVGIGGDGALRLGLSDPKPLLELEERLADTKEGDIVEVAPLGTVVAQAVGARIAAQGGAALIVDYGDWRSLGDTFQAVKAHEPVDPLAEPGLADLTAHVDFERIAAAAPCAHTRLTTQGTFLERLGIGPRAAKLAERLEGEALESHMAAYRRLTHRDEMGTLFKILGLYPHGAAPPPGLDA